MIFSKKDNDLAILGNTLDELTGRYNDFKKILSRGDLFGKNGAFTALFSSSKKSVVTPELLKDFEAFKDLFNESTFSAKALSEELGGNINNQIVEYASNCKNGELTTKEFTASIQGMTIGAKAASLGLKVLSIAGNMVAMWAISQAITGLYKLSQVSEDVAKKAQELGSSFNQTKSSIEDYKAQIEELYQTINNSDSVSEVTAARKNLMAIQDELIQKFGTEAESISNVTNAIHGQTDALNGLSQSQWLDTLNEFNASGVINDLGNYFGGYRDNIDRMLSDYGDYNATISLGSIQGHDLREEAKKILAQFGELQDNGGTHVGYLELSGNANDVQKQLIEIQKAFKNTNIDFGKYFNSELTKASNEAKEVSNQYKALYDQYILYEKVLNDEKYSGSFNNITEKYNAYQDAFATGDSEKIDDATKEYSELLSAAMNEAFTNGDEEVANYFRGMYPTLLEIVEQWKFKVNILPTFDTTDIQSKSPSEIREMLQTNGTQEGEDTFQSILESATACGIVIGTETERIKQLLNLLTDWGVLQSDVATVSREGAGNTPDFSTNLTKASEDINKLKSNVGTLKDSLITLYSGNYSSTELLSSIQDIDAAIKEMGGSLDWTFIESQSNSLELLGAAIEYIAEQYADSILSDMNIKSDSDFGQMFKNVIKDSLEAEAQLEIYKDQINDLSSAYSSLTDIVNSYNESGYLTFDQLTSLLELGPQYLACLVDENGQLSLNQEALFNLANLRLNEAEAQAVSQAITELGQIALLDEQTAVTNNAQAFHDAVNDISAYNTELADTIMETNLAATSVRDLNNALNGASERGISSEQIDATLSNLKTKLGLIGQSRGQLKSGIGGLLGSKSSGTNSTQKEEQPKEFNWLKTREEYLQKEHDNIQKILDDETKSYEEQLDAIDNLIAKNKERLDFFTNALATFQEKWAAASAKLSNEDISNIMHGNDYIGDYTGQYASDVQDAADIYREMISYEEEIADLTQENNDRIREQLKLREEIIQSQQDEIKAQMDLQQSRIDLIEAQGGVVTERMLKNQIQLSENLIDSYKDKIDSLYDQISEVAPDSADYYSLMAEIDACERAIINCKIQQEEWNERIMRLPIERIQKYLNMLAGIKQDLQNFLDEQSAMGIQPSADQLQQLFDISREEIKSLLEQQEKLKDLLEQYKFGSEKFNDVSQELQDIDNTISGLIQSQKEWNASILQIPIDQMSKLNDTLNLVSSSLDNLLSDYDSALSAVTGVIDKQTESLEKLKSAADESYQDKIAPLREELDLLQKQNEERQTEIDLEQKQYHLDKARSQKTNQVVRNGEIIYEADADAIRTANQELSDAEYNKLVKDLGNQISELEEERDKLLESYDTQIEKLNEIKEKWSSIVDEMKLASDISKADKVLGQGWQDKILNGNDDGIYELFKGLYENTTSQKSQLEEQTASNERIAEMMNQFVTRYQEGSLSYEQAMAGIRELSEQMKDGYSSLEQLDALLNLHGVDDLESLLQNMQTGANTSTDQLSKYMELVKANADAMNQYASSWEDMQKNIRDQIAALEKLAEEAAKAVDIMEKHDSNNRLESVIGSGGPNVNNNHYVSSGPGHTAEALADAIAGGKEILEYHTGGLVGAKEAPSRYIGLLSSKNLSDNEVYGKLLKHEWVLTEEQQKIFDSNIKSLLNANHTPRINVSSGFPNVTSAKPNITINMGDTILEHVTKPDEFAHALAAQFKPLLRQEMSKL